MAEQDVIRRKQSLLGVLFDEVVRGSAIGEDDINYLIKEHQIITFLNIPWELEKVLYLGYLVCLDAFLFTFTFLPIRCVVALFKMITWVLKKFLFLETTPIDKGHICDVFRVTIMASCLAILHYFVNISMLYHLIRGQSVIKLYFIYNVLEIVDYLCLSFGNDVMDALFWLTIRNKRRKREHLGTLWHWVLGCIYTIIHTMSFLVQAICLSVAINSHNKSLLVVMISNQYMELKSYLFKKFDKENNYQVVARDIRERFSYTVVLALVCVRNMSQLDWDTSHMWDVLPDVMLIAFSEVIIDWVKHAFVTKFNGIPVDAYVDYRYQLYDDLLNPKFYHQTFSNRMDLMARKILFIPLPLVCLTITVFIEVIPEDLDLTSVDYLKYGCITFAVLFILKVINMGLILNNAEKLRKAAPIYITPSIPPIRNFRGTPISEKDLASSSKDCSPTTSTTSLGTKTPEDFLCESSSSSSTTPTHNTNTTPEPDTPTSERASPKTVTFAPVIPDDEGDGDGDPLDNAVIENSNEENEAPMNFNLNENIEGLRKRANKDSGFEE